MTEPFSLGAYTDKILGYANETFSVLHRKFLKQIWGDNNYTAKLRNNQTTTDWQNGTYEVYIPTRDRADYNLSYYRIAIQILPEISEKTKHAEAYKLMKHLKEPAGDVESELLILIAPHQDRWGLVRAFKHINKRGYMTGIFVNKSPEIIWKRILDHIANFIMKRIEGFMHKLGFETWVWRWLINKDSNLLYYNVLERFSFVIRQSILTFFKLYSHLRDFMKLILRDIGLQSSAKKALEPLIGLKQADLMVVFQYIREKLDVSLGWQRKTEAYQIMERIGAVQHG